MIRNQPDTTTATASSCTSSNTPATSKGKFMLHLPLPLLQQMSPIFQISSCCHHLASMKISGRAYNTSRQRRPFPHHSVTPTSRPNGSFMPVLPLCSLSSSAVTVSLVSLSSPEATPSLVSMICTWEFPPPCSGLPTCFQGCLRFS